jgi:hypothetical protein
MLNYQQRVLSKALIVAKNHDDYVNRIEIDRKKAKPENSSINKFMQSMQPAQICPLVNMI